jgi:hypothetical protein
MYSIPPYRLGIYHRLSYVQNTVGEVGYILLTELCIVYHRTGWLYIIVWAMYRIPQYRLGIYYRLGYVPNTTVQVGYISLTELCTESHRTGWVYIID